MPEEMVIFTRSFDQLTWLSDADGRVDQTKRCIIRDW
jgi:hypothetical protein